MTYQAAAAPAASGSAGTPDDRSQAFRAVEGGTEVQSGSVLLVEAYAAIWIILMAWLLVLWRKQRELHGRLDQVERTIDRAAASKEKK